MPTFGHVNNFFFVLYVVRASFIIIVLLIHIFVCLVIVLPVKLTHDAAVHVWIIGVYENLSRARFGMAVSG